MTRLYFRGDVNIVVELLLSYFFVKDEMGRYLLFCKKQVNA